MNYPNNNYPMSEDAQEISHELEKNTKWFVIGTVIFFILLIGFVAWSVIK